MTAPPNALDRHLPDHAAAPGGDDRAGADDVRRFNFGPRCLEAAEGRSVDFEGAKKYALSVTWD